MAKKLMIVLLNSDPDYPAELGAPFFQATVAAAMEYEVEIIFTGRAGELARSGVAAAICPDARSPRTLHDYIRDAHAAGATLKICSPVQELLGAELIPEIAETVGGAYLISEAMADGTVTFTY
jgi:predicted peroxiredoxin